MSPRWLKLAHHGNMYMLACLLDGTLSVRLTFVPYIYRLIDTACVCMCVCVCYHLYHCHDLTIKLGSVRLYEFCHFSTMHTHTHTHMHETETEMNDNGKEKHFCGKNKDPASPTGFSRSPILFCSSSSSSSLNALTFQLFWNDCHINIFHQYFTSFVAII